MLLHSLDGKPAGAILGAVALTAGLGLLLFMSIKAKGAEDNPDKWRYVEWACLIAYIVVAVLFAAPFQRFFYVLNEKDTMQKQARQEIKAIKNLHQQYEFQQKKFLTEAVEQILNYRDSRQEDKVDPELAAYVAGVGSNVESWEKKASAIVKLRPDAELVEIENKIEGWNLMQLSTVAAELEAKDSLAWTTLEKKIMNYEKTNKLIPVIGGGGGYPYSFKGYAKFDLGTKPEAKFAKMLRESDGNSVLGWIIYVLLNLCVLFNYAVASRSSFVGPSDRGGKTGGLDL